MKRSVIATCIVLAVGTFVTICFGIFAASSAPSPSAIPDRSARPPTQEDARPAVKFAPANATQEPRASAEKKSLSPDKKWEFSLDRDDNGRLIKTGTMDAAVELSLPCGPARGTCHEPIWSPDSKRFAFNSGQSRTRECTFYQLSGNEWKELEPSESVDPVEELLNKKIAAQVKKKGLPPTTDLRLISDTLAAHHWIDSNNLVVFASLSEVVREDTEIGFGAAYLGTVKFAPNGAWKLIKTRGLSDKEAEKYRRGD